MSAPFDHRPAVDRLINGGPPPESWGGPHRPTPPRPLPRHLTGRADLRAVTRRRRVLDALARLRRNVA